MQERRIYITEFDKMRLEELITVADEFGGHAREDLDALIRELDQAKSNRLSPGSITPT